MCVKVRVEQRKNNAIIIMYYIFLLTSSNFPTEAKYENASKKILTLSRATMNQNEFHLMCRKNKPYQYSLAAEIHIGFFFWAVIHIILSMH